MFFWAVYIFWLVKNFWFCTSSLWLCVSSGCEKISGFVYLPSGNMYPLALKKHQDGCSFYPLALCILSLCMYVCVTQDSLCIQVHLTHQTLTNASVTHSLTPGPWLGNVITNCACQYGLLPCDHLQLGGIPPKNQEGDDTALQGNLYLRVRDV